MRGRINLLAVLLISLFIFTACGEEPALVEEVEVPPYPVSSVRVEKNLATTVEATGVVESKSSASVSAGTSGVVSALYVREGSRVSKGTPLFRIGGTNGTPHQLEIQMKSALAQANAAINAYNSTIQSNRLALNGAYLGYQSAVNQTQASQLDQQVFDENRAALQNTLNTLNDTLSQARTKYETDRALAADEAARQTLDATFRATESQLNGQISQSETQLRVLELNQQSVSYKLGLTPTGSFQEAQSWLQVPTTEVRNQSTLSQAKTQVELARNQYELAKTQWEGLLVRAQSSGVVTDMNLAVGSPVSPQGAPALTIVNSGALTADVGLNESDAYLLTTNTPVEILRGTEWVATRIVSISPSVDAVSRKVMVTIAIPANTVRVNGSVSARFKVAGASTVQSSRVYVPLDAVIVSTEETFVFVIENGVAKKRTVTRGAIVHDRIEILEGLSDNEEIIVNGAKNVYDGQPVTVEASL